MTNTPKKYIEVDGVRFVPEGSQFNHTKRDGMRYVVVRSSDSGCHAGYLASMEGNNANLVDARRLWYWAGAATLSELAMNGVAKPSDCKFPMEVSGITVLGCCEVIDCTDKARESIAAVPIWSAS